MLHGAGIRSTLYERASERGSERRGAMARTSTLLGVNEQMNEQSGTLSRASLGTA